MPILLIASLAAQVFLAMHVYRTGKNMYWIFIILFFPGVGSLVYFLVVYLPELRNDPMARKAQRKVQQTLDPDKEYRAAKYAVETTPTVANHLKFAQILMARSDYDGVIATLQLELTNYFANDSSLLEGLAYAYYYRADYRNALLYIKKIFQNDEVKPRDYIKLLRARLYQATGELATARAELIEIVKTFSGEEARVALAQLLDMMGAKEDAQAIYQDIVNRAKHAPKYYRTREREWINIAKTSLL